MAPVLLVIVPQELLGILTHREEDLGTFVERIH